LAPPQGQNLDAKSVGGRPERAPSPAACATAFVFPKQSEVVWLRRGNGEVIVVVDVSADANLVADRDVKVVSETETRREFKLSISAQATIVFAGLLIIALGLAKYGHDHNLWWPPSGEGAREQIVRLIDVSLIVIDGTTKAAILSFAATFILRIDIKKFVERVIESQPLLTDPAEGRRLRDMMRGEIQTLEKQLSDVRQSAAAENANLRTRISQLEAALNMDNTLFERFLQFLEEVRSRNKSHPE
jgi:hypothetical protein